MRLTHASGSTRSTLRPRTTCRRRSGWRRRTFTRATTRKPRRRRRCAPAPVATSASRYATRRPGHQRQRSAEPKTPGTAAARRPRSRQAERRAEQTAEQAPDEAEHGASNNAFRERCAVQARRRGLRLVGDQRHPLAGSARRAPACGDDRSTDQHRRPASARCRRRCPTPGRRAERHADQGELTPSCRRPSPPGRGGCPARRCRPPAATRGSTRATASSGCRRPNRPELRDAEGGRHAAAAPRPDPERRLQRLAVPSALVSPVSPRHLRPQGRRSSMHPQCRSALQVLLGVVVDGEDGHVRPSRPWRAHGAGSTRGRWAPINVEVQRDQLTCLLGGTGERRERNTA